MKKSKIITIDENEYFIKFLPGDRRSFLLRMISSSELEIRFPRFESKARLNEFISKKSGWISKKHDMLVAAEEAGVGNGIFEGRMLFFFGEKYKVTLKGHDIKVEDNSLVFPEGSDLFAIEKWYKAHSESVIADFKEKYSNIIPKCTIKVKKQKRIWGSCNTKSRIYINSKISMCPLEVIEYIMWHEISHLKYMNHSSVFYKQLKSYCPDYKKHKAWLKKHSFMLSI